MGRGEEYEGKKYLMVGDNILDKVLYKIEGIIGIEKFDSKILIDADDQLQDDITWKKCCDINTCIIKDNDRFCLLIVLQESLCDE